MAGFSRVTRGGWLQSGADTAFARVTRSGWAQVAPAGGPINSIDISSVVFARQASTGTKTSMAALTSSGTAIGADTAAKTAQAGAQSRLTAAATEASAKVSVSDALAMLRVFGVDSTSKTTLSDQQSQFLALSAIDATKIVAGIVTTTLYQRLLARGGSTAGKIADSVLSAQIRAFSADTVAKIATGDIASLARLCAAISAAPFVPGVGGLTQQDIDAIAAAVWAQFPAIVAQQIAQAVMSEISSGVVPANVKQVNSVPLTGAGVPGNEWGPA